MPVLAARRAGVRKNRSTLVTALGPVVGSYTATGGQNHDLGSYPYAQPIQPTANMTLSGLTLFIDTFANPGAGSITAGISSTNPATAVTWLGNATVNTGPLGHPSSVDFLFPSAVTLTAGAVYWIVVQGTIAQVQVVPYTNLVMTGMTSPSGFTTNPGGDLQYGASYASTTTSFRLMFTLRGTSSFTVPGAIDATSVPGFTPSAHYSLAYIFHIQTATTVKGVALRLANTGTVGPMKVGFASTNGASPSAVTFDQGMMAKTPALPTTARDWVNFVFDTPVALAVANHYLIVLGNDAAKAGAGVVEWGGTGDRNVLGTAIDTVGASVSYSDDTTGVTAWATQSAQYVPLELLA